MNIALCHFRVGETDGVSLEMDKWKTALERLGHKVIYLAGSKGETDAETIPSLHYNHPMNNKIVDNAYYSFEDYDSEDELRMDIFNFAEFIEKDLIWFIEKHNIDIIVPNNILSLGWGLSAGIAFTRAIKKTTVKAICHHHDFHWERTLYSNPKAEFIKDILSKYFPPIDPNIEHVCINNIAKKELKARYGVDAEVVPNVFDFMENKIAKDSYNRDMRREFEIEENDLIFLQATRVVERKAIELAIDTVAEVQKNRAQLEGKTLYNGEVFTKDSNIYLVFAGQNECPAYYQKLRKYAEEKNVKIKDISHRINHERDKKLDKKIYSLWDAYLIADMITYPSMLEGWGNQFLEGLVAKVPMIVYKYPVYLTDIEQFNFNIVSLGSEHTVGDNDLVKIDNGILETASQETIKYLLDNDYREAQVEYNFNTGNENLSLTSLQNMLGEIFK